MHDVVIVGIPLIAILAGILLNRSDALDLRGEMAALRTEVHCAFWEFYCTLGRHDAKIENLQEAR